MPELTSLYVYSRVDSNTFTMGIGHWATNPMPESTLTLCQSRLYPSGTLDLASDMRMGLVRRWIIVRVCLPPWTQMGEEQQSLKGEGVGDPIRTTEKKAWHSVYSVGWCQLQQQRKRLVVFTYYKDHYYELEKMQRIHMMDHRLSERGKMLWALNFFTDLFANISTEEFFEMLIPFLTRKLSRILYCRILYCIYNCWLLLKGGL